MALGGSYFTDMLFAGEFDWALHDFISSDSSHIVRYNICRYLREQMSKKLAGGVLGPVSSSQWHKEVFLCSSLSTFATKYTRVLRTLVQPEDQIELAIHALAQFNVQWRAAASSPFDLVAIFNFTALSLFDLTPQQQQQQQQQQQPSSSSDAAIEMHPLLAHLVPPLYEAYRLTVLSQDLQAFTLVDRAVAEAPPEMRIVAMLRGLVSGLLLGDLSESCHFGKSFASAVITLLLTLARKFPGLLFPLGSGGSGSGNGSGSGSESSGLPPGMGPMVEDLPLYRMCQQSESPELTLRTALHFLTTVGVENEAQFRAVYCALRSLITAAGAGGLGISEELQCLALRGATSLVVKACTCDAKEDRLRAVLAAPLYLEQREYAVSRAKLVNQMMPLEEVIAAAEAAPTAPAFARAVGIFSAATAAIPVATGGGVGSVSVSPSSVSLSLGDDTALSPLRPRPLPDIANSSDPKSDSSLSSSPTAAAAAAAAEGDDMSGYDGTQHQMKRQQQSQKNSSDVIRAKISLLLTSSSSLSSSSLSAGDDGSDDGGNGNGCWDDCCMGGSGQIFTGPMASLGLGGFSHSHHVPPATADLFGSPLFAVPRRDNRSLRWNGTVDMAPAVTELLCILGGILNAQGPVDDVPSSGNCSNSNNSSSFSSFSEFSMSPTTPGIPFAQSVPQPGPAKVFTAVAAAAAAAAAAGFTVPLSFLQTEAVYSLVLVADLLTGEQVHWLFGLLKQLFTVLSGHGNSADFVLMCCLVHGILKCAALLPSPGQSTARLISDVVRYALELGAAAMAADGGDNSGSSNSSSSSNNNSSSSESGGGGSSGSSSGNSSGGGEGPDRAGLAVALAALDGLRYFVRCAEPRAYLSGSLVNYICKHVLSQLQLPGRDAVSDRRFLHMLAAGFNVVQMFPSECEASGVTQSLLETAVAAADRRGCSAAASRTIFRGLGVLLVTRSLSLRMRRFLEDFAVRKLQGPAHASNPVRSFLALALLVAVMYFGRDPFASPAGTSPVPSDMQSQSSSSSVATAVAATSASAAVAAAASSLPRSSSLSAGNLPLLPVGGGGSGSVSCGSGVFDAGRRGSTRVMSMSTRKYDFNAMTMIDMEYDDYEDEAPQALGMERIQTLYAAVRKGVLARHATLLVDILARVTVDVLPSSQSISFAVSEFIKKFGDSYVDSASAASVSAVLSSSLSSSSSSLVDSAPAPPSLTSSPVPASSSSSSSYSDEMGTSDASTMGLVMAKVFALVEDKPLVYEYVTTCLRSTLLAEGHGLWLSSCLLFAASPSPLLNGLFHNIVYTPKEDAGLFVLAATEFAAIPEMTPTARKELVEILRSTKVPLYARVADKISAMMKRRSLKVDTK